MPSVQINNKKLFIYSRPAATAADSGITFLLIHGLGSSHAFYTTIIPTLNAAGHSCVAYDTYGSGLSKFEQGSQDVKSMAEDAKSILVSLNVDLEKTVVVGHSMGGMVACELVANHPLRGAVLLGPVHPTPAMADVFADRIQKVSQNGMEGLADVIPTAATGSKAGTTQHAFIRALLLSQEPAGYISLCKVIAEATAPDYARIKSPVLVVAGSDDKTAPLSGSQAILQSCGTGEASKKIETLQGVGHWHCIEAPTEVAQLIKDFVANI